MTKKLEDLELKRIELLNRELKLYNGKIKNIDKLPGSIIITHSFNN